MTIITGKYDSAHYLPNVPKGHKCGTMHGHTYNLKVFISEYSGWILDYTDLKNGIKPFIDILDHNLLNDIPGLDNPIGET